MKIVTLLENRKISEELVCDHGLSLYIETNTNKILFDMGTDDSFIINAKKLGIDLKEVDTAIISHGHHDHGGGLEAFLNINKTAKVYLSESAFNENYSKIYESLEQYIGLDQNLKNHEQLVFIKDKESIADNIFAFANVEGDIILPPSNKSLFRKDNNTLIKDDFEHEINLIISDNNKEYLITGCSHKGIVNIISTAERNLKRKIDIVVGGMHMRRIDPKRKDDQALLDNLIKELSEKNIEHYYTCHCTGEKVFNYMYSNMENIDEIMTGSVLEF